DVSFAGQALVLGWLAREHGSLRPGGYGVPPAIDDQVARLALASSGAEIDALTPAQQEDLSSWQPGRGRGPGLLRRRFRWAGGVLGARRRLRARERLCRGPRSLTSCRGPLRHDPGMLPGP